MTGTVVWDDHTFSTTVKMAALFKQWLRLGLDRQVLLLILEGALALPMVIAR